LSKSFDNASQISLGEKKHSWFASCPNTGLLFRLHTKVIRELYDLLTRAPVNINETGLCYFRETGKGDPCERGDLHTPLAIGEAIDELLWISNGVNLCTFGLPQSLEKLELSCVDILKLIDKQELEAIAHHVYDTCVLEQFTAQRNHLAVGDDALTQQFLSDRLAYCISSCWEQGLLPSTAFGYIDLHSRENAVVGQTLKWPSEGSEYKSVGKAVYRAYKDVRSWSANAVNAVADIVCCGVGKSYCGHVPSRRKRRKCFNNPSDHVMCLSCPWSRDY